MKISPQLPASDIFQKPPPKPIKLSQSALIQHNELQKLSEQNQLLQIKIKKCRDNNNVQEINIKNKNNQRNQLEIKLNLLVNENCMLEEEERKIKEEVGNKKKQMVVKQAKICKCRQNNYQLAKQLAQLTKYIESTKIEEKNLKQKMNKKQLSIQETQKNIHLYQNQNAKIQNNIDHVQKDIIKIQDTLKYYKK